jgi:ABC-2 type transport system ATP-binding protein
MEEANRLCHRVGIIRAGRMVAIDAPEKLKTAIYRLHIIEVSFNREVSGEALTGLGGVTEVNRTGDKWQITVENRDATIRSLMAFGQQNGVEIVTLNTLAPSLDEAFLRLTKEAQP